LRLLEAPISLPLPRTRSPFSMASPDSLFGIFRRGPSAHCLRSPLGMRSLESIHCPYPSPDSLFPPFSCGERISKTYPSMVSCVGQTLCSFRLVQCPTFRFLLVRSSLCLNFVRPSRFIGAVLWVRLNHPKRLFRSCSTSPFFSSPKLVAFFPNRKTVNFSPLPRRLALAHDLFSMARLLFVLADL